MTYEIRCGHPLHTQNSARPGWNDGVLGETSVEDHDHGMVCEGCAGYDAEQTAVAILAEAMTDTNRATIGGRLSQVIAANKTLIAATKPSTAALQASAAYDASVRNAKAVNGLIKLLVTKDVDDLTGT